MSIHGFNVSRSLRSAAVAALAVMASATSGLAQDGENGPQDYGFYFSAAGGGVFTNSVRHDFRDIAVVQKYQMDEGFAVQGTAGMRLPMNFRTELEVTYRENDPASMIEANINTPGFAGAGHYNSTTVMWNNLYDLKITDSLTFSPGIGVGAAFTDANIRDAATGFQFARAKQTRFAAQAIAELGWEIVDGVSIFAKWQYLITAGKRQNTFNTGVGTFARSMDYNNHTVLGGFKIDLTTLTGG